MSHGSERKLDVEIVNPERKSEGNEVLKPHCLPNPSDIEVSLGKESLKTCDELKCVHCELIDHHVHSCRESGYFHVSQMEHLGNTTDTTLHEEDPDKSLGSESELVNVHHVAMEKESKSCMKPILEHHSHHEHSYRAMVDCLDASHEPVSNQILSQSSLESPGPMRKGHALELSMVEDHQQSRHFQSDPIVEVIIRTLFELIY
jgi:hypothetical protein